MPRIEFLIDMEEPVLSRAAEAIDLLNVKCRWAAHELLSYSNTGDVADLLEVERILLDMMSEIAQAAKAIQKEINREDAKISAEAVEELNRDEKSNR